MFFRFHCLCVSWQHSERDHSIYVDLETLFHGIDAFIECSSITRQIQNQHLSKENSYVIGIKATTYKNANIGQKFDSD